MPAVALPDCCRFPVQVEGAARLGTGYQLEGALAEAGQAGRSRVGRLLKICALHLGQKSLPLRQALCGNIWRRIESREPEVRSRCVGRALADQERGVPRPERAAREVPGPHVGIKVLKPNVG